MIIDPYSDKNNNTNPTLEYSVLNPLTNSLSPSEKSKGARFVSDNRQINQRGRMKNHITLKQETNIIWWE